MKIGDRVLILGGLYKGVSVIFEEHNPHYKRGVNLNPYNGRVANRNRESVGAFYDSYISFGEPSDLPIILDPLFAIEEFLK